MAGSRINAAVPLDNEITLDFSLEVKSGPWAGAYIIVTPNDADGLGNGTTDFVRKYAANTQVTVTAPEKLNGRNFGFWLVDEKKYPRVMEWERSATITMDSSHIAEAVYPIYDVVIDSYPDKNIAIGVSPADEYGKSDGLTSFTRTYQYWSNVPLTAPPNYGSKAFQFWYHYDVAYYSNPFVHCVMDNGTVMAYYSNRLNWRDIISEGLFDFNSPAIGADRTIYVNLAGTLLACDMNGQKKWECNYNNEGLIYYSKAAVSLGRDQTAYVVARGKLFAITPQGSIKWSFPFPTASVDNPAAAIDSRGTIYFCSFEGILYAINSDGTKRWEYDTHEAIIVPPAVGADGTIYCGVYQGCQGTGNLSIIAVNPDGTKKWQYIKNKITGIASPLAIGSDGTVYFATWKFGGGFGDYLAGALDPGGTEKWIYVMENEHYTSGPVIGGDGSVFVGDGKGLLALDANGNKRWHFEVGNRPYIHPKITYYSWVNGTPAIGQDGAIYFGSYNGVFYALQPDGNIKWEYWAGNEIRHSPTIGPDGSILVLGWGVLLALKSDSQNLGKTPWPKYQHDSQNTGNIDGGFNEDDLLGIWDGQGVYYRSSENGNWVALGPPAETIACGDLFGDYKDELIGVWASLGGTWIRNSADGVWTYLCSAARHLAAGDMNGDGRVDLLGTWDGIGVFYRDSVGGQWVLVAPQANRVEAGDLDGDGKADLIGLWPGLGEIWYRSSLTGVWSFFASSIFK